jgi:hypothetical protein
LSLLSGYLPTRSPTKSAVPVIPEQQVPAVQTGLYGLEQVAEGRTGGKVDMRMSCRCCVGDVIEL